MLLQENLLANEERLDRAKPRTPISVTVEHAEIVRTPKSVKAWVVHQLLTLNLSNIALLIAVLVASSSIQSLLDDQKIQYQAATDASRQLQEMMAPAQARINEMQQIYSGFNASILLMQQFNSTLNRGIELGFLNLTGQLAQLDSRVRQVDSRLTQVTSENYIRRVRDASEFVKRYEWAYSGLSVHFPPGVWLVWGEVRLNNYDQLTPAVCGALSTAHSVAEADRLAWACNTVLLDQRRAGGVGIPPVEWNTCEQQAAQQEIAMMWVRESTDGDANAQGVAIITGIRLQTCP